MNPEKLTKLTSTISSVLVLFLAGSLKHLAAIFASEEGRL